MLRKPPARLIDVLDGDVLEVARDGVESEPAAIVQVGEAYPTTRRERSPVRGDRYEILDLDRGGERVVRQKISGHQGARSYANIASARAAAPRRNSSTRPLRTSCPNVKPPR